MNPIRTKESNFNYLGPTPEIADLPCRVEGANTFGIWMLTEADKKLILEGGFIRLGIYWMRPIPPHSLQVVAGVGPYERVQAPCDVCGNEAENSIHDSGPNTHAYRQRAAYERAQRRKIHPAENCVSDPPANVKVRDGND
jgi:hypothetical protein